MTRKEQEKEQARARLRKVFRPGSTLYVIIRSVSRSGMSRRMDFYSKDGRDGMTWRTTEVALALGLSYGENAWRHGDGARVDGCGMDMAFHCAYSLGRVLHAGRFRCFGEGCPANDHANPPHPKRKAGKGAMLHSDAGYSIKSRIL